NGKEVLALLEKNPYDIILMDIQMPEMDGLEATQSIRANENAPYQQIPIIALTASVMEESVRSFEEAGIDDMVGKPFDPAVLFQKLSQYKQAYRSGATKL
ncbi:MAG: response regulator, partial [Bacteroidota bacterium]